MSLILPEIAAASVPVAPTAKHRLFYNATTGEWASKDAAGTVTSLRGAVGPTGDDGSTLTTLTSSAGVLTIDCALGDNFIVTLTEDITSIVLSNEPASGVARSISLEIVQDAATARTVVFPAGWRWPDGVEGAVSTVLGAVDELGLIIRNPSGTKRYSAVLVNGWA